MAEWTECWSCFGSGFTHHDCGEDTCPCLHPEDNVECDICSGEGGYDIEEGEDHMGGAIPSEEAERKQWAIKFDEVIETCKVRTKAAMQAAILEAFPHLSVIQNYDWENSIAVDRIEAALRRERNAAAEAAQMSLLTLTNKPDNQNGDPNHA